MPAQSDKTFHQLKADLLRWLNRLLLVMNIVVLCGGLWVVGAFGLQHDPSGWTYQDLVSVLLTAIGVLLAIVALFVAVLAIWGYSALKEAAAEVAAKKAEQVAREVAGPIAARAGAEASNTVDPDGADGLVSELKENG